MLLVCLEVSTLRLIAVVLAPDLVINRILG